MFCCTKSKPKKKGTEKYYISLTPMRISLLSDIHVASDCSPNTNALTPNYSTTTLFKHAQSFKSDLSQKNSAKNEFLKDVKSQRASSQKLQTNEYLNDVKSQRPSSQKLQKPIQNIYSHNRSKYCEIF
ncbi:hypothetical protein SteCoe_31346 [Stentor coeruleus]|uniref:Uncharacterized protein n=1 Tax=Stentor coeruleus TaxID=5963 RepID=A0A1R2B1Q5_9CILI|nr:hypothetical protein SteCoe_31346 [Stentor coeruleus]